MSTAERQARHLAMLRELAELGMDLARAAAQQALAETTPPGTDGSGEAARPADGAHRPPDPGLTFARLSRAVRQTIALEARIAAGDPGRQRPDRPPADPRLATIRRTLPATAEITAGGTALPRAIDEWLEDPREDDPDGTWPIDAIIATIGADFGLRLDPSRLPDAALPPFDPVPPPPQPGAVRPSAVRPSVIPLSVIRPVAVSAPAWSATPSPCRSGPDPP